LNRFEVGQEIRDEKTCRRSCSSAEDKQSHAQTKEQVRLSFGGNETTTSGILTFDKKGHLYGVAYSAGASENGVVFELIPARGRRTKFHSFLDPF